MRDWSRFLCLLCKAAITLPYPCVAVCCIILASEKVQWCRDNDVKCQEIVAAAKRFYEAYLSRDALLDYLQILLQTVAGNMVQEACEVEAVERVYGGSTLLDLVDGDAASAVGGHGGSGAAHDAAGAHNAAWDAAVMESAGLPVSFGRQKRRK